MLKGVSPLLSPDLLATLYAMGHGETIVLADAHFPAMNLGPRILRADGLPVDRLLEGIMPLIELDTYVEHPVYMMAPVPGDHLNEELDLACRNVVKVPVAHLERFKFYEEAAKAYAIVITGETRQYGNIILRKGVILS